MSKSSLLTTKTKECRHGTFTYFGVDEYVGLSLDLYGEYSEFEVLVINKVLKEGDVALNIGANIGALTVPMSKAVGETGQVFAFEPGKENHGLLCVNLLQNKCQNTAAYPYAVSDRECVVRTTPLDALGHFNFGRLEVTDDAGSVEIEAITIDSLALPSCKFMLIDVEGFEARVIRGAAETIRRCRPIMMVENDRSEKSAELIATIYDLGYLCYWFRPPLFNPNNFFHEKRNVFPNIVSLNMICVPDESVWAVEGCDDVADLRDDEHMFSRERDRYARRVEKDPADLEARLMVAHYSNMMQDEDTANAALAENLSRDPDHVPTRAIKGLLGLQRGDYTNWKNYELRFHQKSTILFGGHRKFGVPQWDGQPTDKVVLVWSEQGFGDQIMFVRFMRQVLERAPNAILETPAEMHELFESSHVSPNGLYRMRRTLPDFDCHCSITSLPAVLGLDAEEQMQVEGPYLEVDVGLADHWGSRRNPKIGICNIGSVRSERPYTRDIPNEMLSRLCVKHGPVLNLVQNGQFHNFADTAAAIMNLDLVITVDTSIAHLSGALGVPTWLLLSTDPDWRWGLKEYKTVWYDTMHIFRQPKFRDWASVIEQVDQELEKRIAYAA